MRTVDERQIDAPPERVFAAAADVERWPAILPHYRWVRMLERSAGTAPAMTAPGMAARCSAAATYRLATSGARPTSVSASSSLCPMPSVRIQRCWPLVNATK